jgi:hypothetical protein
MEYSYSIIMRIIRFAALHEYRIQKQPVSSMLWPLGWIRVSRTAGFPASERQKAFSAKMLRGNIAFLKISIKL